MAYKINEGICIACGQCEAVCPIAAPAMKDGKYSIDPAKCVGCGTCAENCPVGAIAAE